MFLEGIHTCTKCGDRARPNQPSRIKSHVLGFMGYLIPVPALDTPTSSIEVCVANAHARTRPRSGRKLRYRVRVTKNSISIIISTTASMWPPCVCTPHTYGCPNAIPDRDPPDEMSDLAGFACHTGQLRECFGCRWRGGEAVDRTITGAFGIVTELLVVLQPLSQHDLTLQVQRMAGALRRTDWSSTPHPTPRDAPPESVCCLVSVTVMRASLGTVNTCLS
jgi:hypothetical protein